jgi:hypothetical protein
MRGRFTDEQIIRIPEDHPAGEFAALKLTAGEERRRSS